MSEVVEVSPSFFRYLEEIYVLMNINENKEEVNFKIVVPTFYDKLAFEYLQREMVSFQHNGKTKYKFPLNSTLAKRCSVICGEYKCGFICPRSAEEFLYVVSVIADYFRHTK